MKKLRSLTLSTISTSFIVAAIPLYSSAATQASGPASQTLDSVGVDQPRALDPLVFDIALKDAKPQAWRGVTKKSPSNTRYFLPTGFVFPARLQNAVYSFNVESPVIAVVDEEIQYQKKVVIPSGTQVIGTVSVQQDHDRILITFHTIVFPEGDEIKFTGLGLSLDGSLGIKGKVETHKDSAIADTVLSSVVSGAQEAAMMTTAINPVATSALSGLAGEATGELGTQRQKITTSISVNSGTGLRIYLPKRIEY